MSRQQEQELPDAPDPLVSVAAAVERIEKYLLSTSPLLSGLHGAAMAAESRSAQGGDGHPPVEPALPHSYAAQIAHLQQLMPRAFDAWHAAFEHSAGIYRDDPVGSISDRANPFAEGFRSFIRLWSVGRILDQGCGIYGRPSYLEGIAAERLAAIEPLEMKLPADFPVARAFTESIPWSDGVFETVVSATSLDHVLCLDTSLAEIRRVLTPGGRFLIWTASIDGAPPWTPELTTAVDAFHMFHVDARWFEPKMQASGFRLVERVVLAYPGFDHVYYRFDTR